MKSDTVGLGPYRATKLVSCCVSMMKTPVARLWSDLDQIRVVWLGKSPKGTGIGAKDRRVYHVKRISLHPKNSSMELAVIWGNSDFGHCDFAHSNFGHSDFTHSNFIHSDFGHFLGDLRWVAWFGLKWAKLVQAKSRHVDGRNLWWLEFSQQWCFSLWAHADICSIFSIRLIELVIIITVD